MAWKTEFDIKRLAGKKTKMYGNGKISGRDLFMQNADLNASDLQFISTEEDVDFDEALFDDLDGLDIEDED